MVDKLRQYEMLQYFLYMEECHRELIEKLTVEYQFMDCHAYLLHIPMYGS